MITPIGKKNNIKLNYDRDKLRRLCKRYGLRLVILHGSFATGHVRKESDIDIGILGKAESLRKNYFDIVARLSGLLGETCDPVILNNSETMIVYQVAIKGIPLYEARKGLFAEFKMSAISRYQDAAKFHLLEKVYLQSVINKVG
jgi:predicted nucleotidyltransferase